MRALLLLFTFGALLMATAAPTDAQDEKKDEPPPKDPFTERVTYRYWSAEHNKFLRESRVDARRILDKQTGQVVKFAVATRGRAISGLPPVRSELEDKDGVTWVIVKSTAGDIDSICTVVKKPAPKAKASKKG